MSRFSDRTRPPISPKVALAGIWVQTTDGTREGDALWFSSPLHRDCPHSCLLGSWSAPTGDGRREESLPRMEERTYPHHS